MLYTLVSLHGFEVSVLDHHVRSSQMSVRAGVHLLSGRLVYGGQDQGRAALLVGSAGLVVQHNIARKVLAGEMKIAKIAAFSVSGLGYSTCPLYTSDTGRPVFKRMYVCSPRAIRCRCASSQPAKQASTRSTHCSAIALPPTTTVPSRPRFPPPLHDLSWCHSHPHLHRSSVSVTRRCL
jgi:hypothetical protein